MDLYQRHPESGFGGFTKICPGSTWPLSIHLPSRMFIHRNWAGPGNARVSSSTDPPPSNPGLVYETMS
jgi:hypothetical protein